MTILTQKAVVAAEIEAVEGTAEVLVAGDAGFLVFNPRFEPDIAMNERDPSRAVLSPVAMIPGARQARITFECELVGSSAAGTPPLTSDLLKGCGFSETIVAVTSVTYKPASTAIPSLTIGMWLDGKKYLMWGCRGNVSIRAEIGKPIMLAFEFTGADFTVTDEALLAGVTYETVLPAVFLDATLTVGAYAAVLNTVEINMGNTLQLRSDANAASGYVSCLITNRKVNLRIDPENVIVATYDFFGNWRAATEAALAFDVGSVAGNKVAISAPKIQFGKITIEDRGGISTLGIEGQCNVNAGDDELVIAIT